MKKVRVHGCAEVTEGSAPLAHGCADEAGDSEGRKPVDGSAAGAEPRSLDHNRLPTWVADAVARPGGVRHQEMGDV